MCLVDYELISLMESLESIGQPDGLLELNIFKEMVSKASLFSVSLSIHNTHCMTFIYNIWMYKGDKYIINVQYLSHQVTRGDIWIWMIYLWHEEKDKNIVVPCSSMRTTVLWCICAFWNEFIKIGGNLCMWITYPFIIGLHNNPLTRKITSLIAKQRVFWSCTMYNQLHI